MGMDEVIERLLRVPETANADDAAVEAPKELEPGAAPEDGEDTSETLLRLEVTTDVVESLALGYHLGAALERIIVAAERGSDGVQPLREAVWLLERYAALLEERPVGADIHRTSVQLGRNGEALAELRAVSEALRQESTPEPAPAVATEASESDGEPEPEPLAGGDSETPVEPHVSFAREIGMTAFRWALLVAAVIVVVLALTLIGDWHG